MRSQILKTLLFAALLPGFISGCAMRASVPLGTIPAPKLPSQEDRVAAEAFVDSYISEQGYDYIEKGKDLEQVNRVLTRLNDTAGFPRNAFVVKVVDAGDEVNAMTAGGASVVVYKMLLERVKNDEELAVVLAHELGHVLAGHSEENEKLQERSEIVSIGSTILGSIASIAAAASGIGGAGLIGDVTEGATGVLGYGAFVGSFDRDQEYEADQIGLMLFAKAGYDPKVALDFWSRSEEVFGTSSSTVGSFFSTHPAATDRVAALEKALPVAEQYYQEAKLRAPSKSAPQVVAKGNSKKAKSSPAVGLAIKAQGKAA